MIKFRQIKFMILGPKNAIDLKIINIYNLERTSTLLFSLEIVLSTPAFSRVNKVNRVKFHYSS